MENMSITSSGSIGIRNGTNTSYYYYNPSSNVGLGCTNPSQILTVTSNKMKQVKAVLFTVTRDPKTNEIIDSEFVKEFWVKQKPGVSFEVAASFVLGYAINPDNEIIREVLTMSLY